MEEWKVRYFLGANTGWGFVSLYDELIDQAAASGVYVLKGGPGCGKSTLMKQVGAELEANGLAVEYIHCSEDPDALDGIFIPEKNAAVADGSAPHVLEPLYPGVTGHYVNLEDCCDRVHLRADREELIFLLERYRDQYFRAGRCLSAAEQMRRESRGSRPAGPVEEKLEKRVRGILARETGKKSAWPGRETKRFLRAVTSRGLICFPETVRAQCGRVYELLEADGLAHWCLKRLRDGLLAAGNDVVTCLSPEDPGRLDHLLIPGLSLAFVTAEGGERWEQKPWRRIRMETFLGKETARAERHRRRFARRMAEALTAEGIQTLGEAKQFHDRSKEIYAAHVDFSRVRALAASLTDEILSLPGGPSPADPY